MQPKQQPSWLALLHPGHGLGSAGHSLCTCEHVRDACSPEEASVLCKGGGRPQPQAGESTQQSPELFLKLSHY